MDVNKIKQFLYRACIACIVTSLCACSSSGEIKSKRPLQSQIDAALKEQQTEGDHVVDMPPEVSQSLLPPLEFRIPDTAARTRVEDRFDVNAEVADIRQLLSSLSESSGYSLLMSPDVKGDVSLQLKNVTLLEAMESIRDLYGYEYQRDGKRILIYGTDLRTEMFPVNYLNFTRKGRSDISVSSTGISSSGGEGGATSGAAGVELETESEANFWQELTEALKALVGEQDGRRVIANPQAGLVVVKANSKELRMVRDFLGMTHETLNRQVSLEAKIIEVELSDHFQSGINWTGLVNAGASQARANMVGGGSVPDSGGVSGTVGNSADLVTSDPLTSTASAFGGVFSIALRSESFSTFVELLQSQGNVQVLSSPRVSTVNNQKAVIKVGGDEYFVTGVTNQSSTTGSTTTQAPTVELQPFFSGIALDVTPQIDEWENINLHIHPSISEVSQKSKSFVIGDQTFSIPLAFSTVQESDNVVRARSGQIIVIGGLMKDSVKDEEASIPFLGDIPFVGNLFKHKRVSRVKKELVILLKPTVIENDGYQWQKQLTAQQRRINLMGGFAQQ